MASEMTTTVIGDGRRLSVDEAAVADRSDWDALVASLPSGDPLQAWGWGEAIASGGRERPVRLLVRDGQGHPRGVAQILVRPTAFGRRVLYLPHGPTWDAAAPDCDAVLDTLIEGIRTIGRKERGIVAKLDLRATPELPADLLAGMLRDGGLRRARYGLQARTTRLLDLTIGTDALCAALEKDTRNAIRRAAKEGVVTRVVRDADPSPYATFAVLLAAMGARAGIRVRSADFLGRLAAAFAPAGSAYLVLADHQDRTIAGCLALTTGMRAFYIYAGSLRDSALRHTFGSYATLWTLCRALAADGRTSLDLWGVSEPGDPDADPRWEGYSLFKRGFGGTQLRHPGVFDLILDPFWYWVRDWRERLASRPPAIARST